jgi:hypothetical protein
MRAETLGHIEAAIDELLALDPSTVSDAELHALVVGAERAESRFALARSRLLRAWDARRVWSEDGSRAAWSRLSRECRLAGPTARAELARARKLSSLPVTCAAVAEGKLSVDDADALAAVATPERAELFARDEAMLVDEVRGLLPFQVPRVLAYWAHAADDALGTVPSTERHPGRHLDAHRGFRDAVEVRGTLDALGGTEFLSELDRLERWLWEHDQAQGSTRTGAQRRADALVEMARRSRALPEGVSPVGPTFTVVLGLESLGRICELADGTVIAPGRLVPYLAEADIERIVFESPSRVIDVGVKRRFFSGALRRAIEVRDRHCQHPSGCDVPAERCQIDHVVPYSQGGLTIQANGRCYCDVHNRRKGDRREDDSPRPPPPDDG